VCSPAADLGTKLLPNQALLLTQKKPIPSVNAEEDSAYEDES
jgi:hypothetical protein